MVPRLFCLMILAAFAPGAKALDVSSDKHPFLALDVVVEVPEPYEWHSFGKLRAFMRALERAGHSCKGDSYAHGVNISCGEGDGRILIDLVAEPTRAPEFLNVDEIRPAGVNGVPVPVSGHIAFLTGLLRKNPK